VLKNLFFKKYIHEINDESIGELLSTKAVISDINRQVLIEENPPQREINKKNEKIKNIYR